MAFVLQMFPVGVLAAPSRSPRPKIAPPQAPRGPRTAQPADPLLQKVLQGIDRHHGLADIPEGGGQLNNLIPDLAQTALQSAQSSGSGWGTASGIEQVKNSAPPSSGPIFGNRVSDLSNTDGADDDSISVHRQDDDEHEDKDNEDGCHDKDSLLAFAQARPQDAFPDSLYSRQAHLNGEIYPLSSQSGAYGAFSADYLVHIAPRITPGLNEVYTIDVTSPDEKANKTTRKTAASLVVSYKGVGSSPSAIASTSTLQWKLYSKQFPGGRIVHNKTEKLLLPSLKMHLAVGCKSVGDWKIVQTRNGTEVSSDTIKIQDATGPSGWNRLFGNGNSNPISPPLVGFTTDDGLLNNVDYPIPAFPAGHSEQVFKVCWKLVSPESCFNKIHGAYQEIEAVYKTDGNSWSTTTTVKEPGYPEGRVRRSEGQGTLTSLPLSARVGFPCAGDWRFQEKIDKAATTTTVISIRHITSKVTTLTSALYTDTGSVPFRLSFDTAGTNWVPSVVDWKLALVDASGQAIREYSGRFSDNADSQKTWTQIWDCKDASQAPVKPGATITPVLTISIPAPEPVQAAARVIGSRPNRIGLTPATTDRTVDSSWQAPTPTKLISQLSAAQGTILPFLLPNADGTFGNPNDTWQLCAGSEDYKLNEVYLGVGWTHLGRVVFQANVPDPYVFVPDLPVGQNNVVAASAQAFTVATQDQAFIFRVPNNEPLKNLICSFYDSSSSITCGQPINGNLYLVNRSQNNKAFLLAVDYTWLNLQYGFTGCLGGYWGPLAPYYPPAIKPPDSTTQSKGPKAQTNTCECIASSNGDPYNSDLSFPTVNVPQVVVPPVVVPQVQSQTLNFDLDGAPEPSPCEIGNSPIGIKVMHGSGRFYHAFSDLAIPTRGLALTLSRSYSSDQQNIAPRFGWNWNFQDKLMVEPVSGTVLHIHVDGKTHAFAKNESTFTPTESEVTDRLTQIDERHYQILTQSKLRLVYEVPSGVAVSTTEPYSAPIKLQIDRNGNTNTLYWDALGKRVQRIEGPDPSQYLKFSWSHDRGPDKVFDHTGRCVVYRYRSFEVPESQCQGHEGEKDWVLSKVTQPGDKVYQHSYHKVLGERRYQLLGTRLNGVLQEKVVSREDQPGVLQEYTHRLGVTTSFERDNSGAAPTTTLRHTADPSRLPQGVTQVRTYTLNDEDRVLGVTDHLGRHTSHTLDDKENITSATDALGHTLFTATFDDRHHPLTVTDSLGRTTTMTWLDDNLMSSEDAFGKITLYGYDGHSNRTSVRDPANHLSRIDYTNFGQPRVVTDSLGHSWNFTYNSLGYLKEKIAPPSAPGQPIARWRYTVDSLGRCKEAEDPLKRKVTFRYDLRNHLVETTIPAVSAKFRQPALPEGQVTSEIDNNDLLRSTKALDGKVTTYFYDEAHHLIAVRQPGTSQPTRLEYNALEQVVKVTNSNGKSTLYERDSANQVTRTTYPGGASESFVYDDNSNLKIWNRGDYTVTYSYDGLNRLEHISSPTTHDDITFTFDKLDRIKTMTDNSGTTSYSYKPNYLLESITRPGNKVMEYQFDQGDRLEHVLDPEGMRTDYTYSDRNELTSVTHDSKTVRYEHDLLGRTMVTRMPNGVEDRRTYSERDQLLSKEYLKAGAPLITLKYGFNQLGQRVVGEQIDSAGSILRRYTYNDRRELTGSTKDGPRHQHSETHYDLDQNDNITNNNGTTFKSNGADQLVQAGALGLSYNGAGQATAVGGQSLTFAYNDQITSVTAPGLNAQYLYDGNGQRVQKTVNGVVQKFLWNGGNLAKEYKADGTVRADYQLGAGAKIDGKWQFYLTDIQGSTLGVADDTGRVIATWEYSDYGVTTQTSGDHGLYQPMLYTHCELDAETGFYHNRARHYAPKLAKFMARDPIASNNLYSYCGGDPINFVDPSGLESYVYFGDGTSITTSSGLGLKIAIQNAAPGSITAVITRGHGGTNSADATSADVEAGGFAAVGDRTVLQYKTSSGAFKYIGVAELLSDKLAPGGFIGLNNCSTATGDDNIARSISRSLPTASVRGVDGTINEGSKFGNYYDTPGVGSGFVYYNNGDRVGNGAQIQNQYTVFGRDSASYP